MLLEKKSLASDHLMTRIRTPDSEVGRQDEDRRQDPANGDVDLRPDPGEDPLARVRKVDHAPSEAQQSRSGKVP